MERKDNNTAESKQHKNEVNSIKKKIRKERKTSKGQRTVIGLLLGFILCFTGMWIYLVGIAGVNIVSDQDYTRYQKAVLLENYVEENFYTDIDKNSISEGMYKGILEGLDDPYSVYMTADEYQTWIINASGEYEGAGLTITLNDAGYAEVISVYDDSPAKKAGFKTGDLIISVDGKEYSSLDEIASHMRGEAGTTVKIGYIRDGKKKEVEIKREKLKTESVTSKVLEGKVGYIRISQFVTDTGKDFVKAIEKMENKNVKGVIIDLRNNGGGLVDEAIKVADELLPACTVVRCISKNGKEKAYKSEEGKTDLKYVLLVDGGTASASEIVTAAVKDNEGGKIIGTKTFGKGVIQNTVQLEDGSAIKLTIMQYVSPKGNVIHKEGISPDKEVEIKEGSKTDSQLAAAQKVFEK